MSELVRHQDVDERRLAPGVTLRDMVSVSDINIAELTISKGEYPEGHYALNTDVTMIITGLYKQCTIQRKGELDVVLNTGDFLIVPPNMPYRYVAEFCKVSLTSSPAWTADQYSEEEL